MKHIFGHIVDIDNQRIFDAEIQIEDGRIVKVSPSQEPLNDDVPYILPGFVDAHIHIESTLLVPHHFAPVALSHGTVAVVADPHEIANVLGEQGFDFMLHDAAKVPFGFHFCVPSCVPSTPFETAGASVDSALVAKMLRRPSVVGLAEMMNVPGVLMGDPEVMAKLAAAQSLRKPIDGHAPMLSGSDLEKYISAGISTDHECSTLAEAEEKIAKGMLVLIREGSAACNFKDLSPLLAKYPDKLMFCTDDIYPDELIKGHIDLLVRRAVAKGLPLWNVLRAACLTPVRHYGLHSGLLHEGDSADFICVGDLHDFSVLSTYIRGEEVYSCRNSQKNIQSAVHDVDAVQPNQFRAEPLSLEQLRVPVQGEKMRVITATDGQLLTGCMMASSHPDPADDVLKLVVYNRYQPADPQIAFIHGFGLTRGAFATTIAHDCHNIIAVGCDDQSLLSVINQLVESRGGIAATDGEQVCSLPLPVAGLMSDKPSSEVAAQLILLKRLVRDLGCTMSAPFMTLSFMALPVIPQLKLTDKGLFDGIRFAFTSLFEN